MFVRPDADRSRLPVVLLTGCLGSGKTTLINALLRDPAMENTAVAVNEFGETPLDNHLIDAGADRIVTLANGCLCCNLAGDMEQAVMRIFSARAAGALSRFARLIVEPSGLADPAPIAQAILRNPVMSRALRLDSIICTVDAVFADRNFAEHEQARKQVALADTVVITKADMVDAATLAHVRALVQEENPVAPVTLATQGDVDAASLLPDSFLRPDAPGAVAPRRSMLFADEIGAAPGADHAAATLAVSLVCEAKLDWPRLELWLRHIRIRFADHLLRLKGIVDVAQSRAPIALHGIHHVLHAPVQLREFPQGRRGTSLVLLTRGVARGTIEALWADALPGLLASPAT